MAHRLPKTSARAGFTLIEVMLSLSLFALLGAILYGAMSIGQAASQKGQASFEKNQHLRSVTDLLGSYMRSAYPFRASLQDPAIFYQGDEEELSFISAYSIAMGGRGMAKIHVRWDHDSGGSGALKLDEELPASADGETSGGYRNSFVLREGISEFHFSYLDPQPEKDDWAAKWDGKEKRMLPRAVRLTFRGAGGPEIQWVFPVMMTVLAP